MTAEGQQFGSGRMARWGDILRSCYHWEYWPAWVFYLPLTPLLLWEGLKAGHPLFFTRVNPAIPCGGLFGESKWGIMRLFPPGLFPPTAFVSGEPRTPDSLRESLNRAGVCYPLVAKPDVGERGHLVRRCPDEATLLDHLSAHPERCFLLQQWVNLPEELSVLAYRLPGEERVRVSSLCAKRFLSVLGDGRRRVEALLAEDLRGRRQLARLRREYPALLATVPPEGERLLVEPIGNHCRGTLFLDWNDRIGPALEETFRKVMGGMDGVHYGRFDLRCRSLEALERGEDFLVLEFNGVSSEPAHIYQPGRPLWKAYRDVVRHWRVIAAISRRLARQGVPAAEWRSLFTHYRRWRSG